MRDTQQKWENFSRGKCRECVCGNGTKHTWSRWALESTKSFRFRLGFFNLAYSRYSTVKTSTVSCFHPIVMGDPPDTAGLSPNILGNSNTMISPHDIFFLLSFFDDMTIEAAMAIVASMSPGFSVLLLATIVTIVLCCVISGLEWMVDVRCIICVSVLSRRYSLTPVLPHRLFTITAWALGVYQKKQRNFEKVFWCHWNVWAISK